MKNDLQGKTALVVGGSRGIGAAIVERLAEEGVSVIFTYITPSDAIDRRLANYQQQGQQVDALQADSSDAEQLKAAVDQAARQLNGLDILIYNAGILVTGKIDDFSLEDFDRMLAVNVRGPFVAIKSALDHFRPNSRIITIGSIAGDAARGAGSTVYGMTKAAVARMVRGLAWDLADRGILINDVQPGPVATDMTPNDGPLAERLKAMNPLQRMGEAKEVANLVAWLVSSESSYVNGAGMRIDGGFSI